MANPNRLLVIKDVRFSYLKAFKPGAAPTAPGQTPKLQYSTAVLLPKNHPQIPEIKKIITELIEEKWPDPKKRPAGLKKCLRDGDNEETGRPDDPAYAGHYFFNAYASVSQPPGLLGPNKLPVSEESGWQSGDYGHVQISFYAFERPESKGVAAGLNHIMFARKGESLTGRTSADDAFADVEAVAGEGEASGSMFD